MAEEGQHMEREDIRAKLQEMTTLEQGILSLMEATSAGPLVSSLVQARQVLKMVEDESHWPPVHLRALEAEIEQAKSSAEMAVEDVENLIVEAVFLQQSCRCDACQRDKAHLN